MDIVEKPVALRTAVAVAAGTTSAVAAETDAAAVDIVAVTAGMVAVAVARGIRVYLCFVSSITEDVGQPYIRIGSA